MSVPSNAGTGVDPALTETNRRLLFWACFVALVATSFGFIVRAFLIDTWGETFGLTATEKGLILGVGLWPFAISIILFSLFIDRIGYGTAMIFAFVCHVLSVILTVTATGYTQLYWAMFIVALANGTVEAVINPVVATLFPREKTKWLNILHAGWPGGLVLGGVLALIMGPGTDWRYKVGLILLPTIVYGIMMMGRKFPVQERVAAGVSYREMLVDFGVIGALIVNFLIFLQIGQVFGWPALLTGAIIVILTVAFGAFIGFAPGRPLFIFLLLLMIPLATTELGVDSWVTSFMTPEMTAIGLQAGWVLVYTSLIMMILRFFAGPIVHRISPLGLLAASSAIALVGLYMLSQAVGIMILVAATLYALGKTFFWPTMLGVVAEQFPRGGALTLNATGGVGMLGVGVVGAVLLGYIQDTSVESRLRAQQPAIHQQVVTQKSWAFGAYQAVDPERVSALPQDVQQQINGISDVAKKEALVDVCIFPGIMLISYLGLLFYFKTKGGYKAEELTEAPGDDTYAKGEFGPKNA
ncbi:MAG: MFS transporter [Armatimonadetes bacterium]|nr:MFS transporter [Armatimonadota bacterium]